ncbi:MAG: hypothetical protein IH973_09470 [Myxococcales bacterium]|nr:hypothetical protein [Myxococcales bacterium]
MVESSAGGRAVSFNTYTYLTYVRHMGSQLSARAQRYRWEMSKIANLE